MHASASIGDATKEGGSLSHPAPSVTSVVIFVSCAFRLTETARSLRACPQAGLTGNCFLTKNVALSSQLSQI